MTRTRPTSLSARWRHGLLAASFLFACWSLPASGTVSSNPLLTSAAFAQAGGAGSVSAVFLTDAGVYGLDADSAAIRVWPRTRTGAQAALFRGTDASGAGTAFNQPLGLAKHPAENKLAVVNGGEYKETKLVRNIPSIQVFSFDETMDSGAVLKAADFTFEGEFRNAFFRTTTGMEQVYLGSTVVATITAVTNVIGVSSNWVYVVAADPDPLVTRTNDWDNAATDDNRKIAASGEPVFFPDERFLQLSPGFEYPIRKEIKAVTSATTNLETVAHYDYVYTYTTNASLLSTATDVAFVGDDALVALFTDCGYAETVQDGRWDDTTERTVHHVVPGLAFFNLADPSEWAVVYPLATNRLCKEKSESAVRTSGLAVDPDTGEIYVSVSSASTVLRYAAPVPGDPASWLSSAAGRSHDTLAVQSPVRPDETFAAGVPGMSGTTAGTLSIPQGLSLWRPDAGTPILLVADRSNDRIAAFDTVATVSITNWLGTSAGQPLANGVPVDPAVGFTEIPTDKGVRTNWYRVETAAFPLFEVSNRSIPLKNPEDVFGQDGTNVLAVADTGSKSIRLHELDLSALDSPDVLSMATFWPAPQAGFPDLSTGDFFFGTDELGLPLACRDAPHANAAAVSTLLVPESDDAVDTLRFTVLPARFDRTYALSFESAHDVLEPVAATADVPAGATTGEFSFRALDGIERPWTNVVWWVPATHPSGLEILVATNEWAEGAAFAETNVWRAWPVHTAVVSLPSAGYATNAPLVVLNAAPAITNAQLVGEAVASMFGPPYVHAHGLALAAADVAADAGLTYAWWATTNRTWAANNRNWAVTNHDWAASADTGWTAFDGVEGVDLLVARGPTVALPFGYNAADYTGGGFPVPGGGDAGTAPFFLVCTVLDKDGGATVLAFPENTQASEYEEKWTLKEVNCTFQDFEVAPVVPPDPAVYAAVFTAVSGTNVAFRLALVSGEPAPGDAVTLQYAPVLRNAWTNLFTFSPGVILVYGMTVSGQNVSFETGETAAATLVPDTAAGTIDADFVYDAEPAEPTRFYRIVQP